jgi:GNAT superfamily N-acetyltransferase
MNETHWNFYNFYKKFDKARKIFLSKGFSGLINQLIAYLKSNLKEKWKYTYFVISLENETYTLPQLNNSINIRIATPLDVTKIECEIFPFLTQNQENDKRDISRIGQKGMTCFVAERDKKIVHYFLVFDSALESPLIKTPFDKGKILENDAYLGSTFTIPDARGLWILPHSLLFILSFLRNTTNASRALLLVHEDTPGAVGFFSRLGFKKIEDASPTGPITAIYNKLFKR